MAEHSSGEGQTGGVKTASGEPRALQHAGQPPPCGLQAAGASCERAEQGPCWWALRAPRSRRMHAMRLPSTECYERGLARPHHMHALPAHDHAAAAAPLQHDMKPGLHGQQAAPSTPAVGGTGQGLRPPARLSVMLHACELTRT